MWCQFSVPDCRSCHNATLAVSHPNNIYFTSSLKLSEMAQWLYLLGSHPDPYGCRVGPGPLLFVVQDLVDAIQDAEASKDWQAMREAVFGWSLAIEDLEDLTVG